MKTRTIPLVLLFVVFIGVCTVNHVLNSRDSEADAFLEFYQKTPTSSLVSEEEWAQIRADFSEELSFVADTYQVDATIISEDVMQGIHMASLQHAALSRVNFYALSETIADTAFTNAIEQFNTMQERKARDQLELKNTQRTTVKPYDGVEGTFIEDVPIGTTATFHIKGEEYTVDIPFDTYIGDTGYHATHAYLYFINFARIERCSFDVCNADSGEVLIHYNSGALLRDSTEEFVVFDVMMAAPTYVLHADGVNYTEFPTIHESRDAIAESPSLYLW